MADFNIFGNAVEIFRKFFGIRSKDTEIPEASMKEAEEILYEIFEQFLLDVSDAEPNSALLETELTTTRGRTSSKGRSVPKVSVEVDGYLYNWFDKGYNATLRAGDYTVTAPESPNFGEKLKAFPILVRESAGTTPNSLEVVQLPAKEGKEAKFDSVGSPNRQAGDPVIFRRSAKINITPRNFTQTIAKLAQEELERRGITGIVIEAIDG